MAAYFTTPISSLTARYRIFYEDGAQDVPYAERSDYEELRGTSGARIYRFGPDRLAVSTESVKQYGNLLRNIPGLTVYTSCVLLFPDVFLDQVAEAIQARRKRRVSAEERHRLRRLSQQFSPLRQKGQKLPQGAA